MKIWLWTLLILVAIMIGAMAGLLHWVLTDPASEDRLADERFRAERARREAHRAGWK